MGGGDLIVRINPKFQGLGISKVLPDPKLARQSYTTNAWSLT